MTVRSLLAQGYDTLFYAEVQTPFLDAVVLLAHAMKRKGLKRIKVWEGDTLVYERPHRLQ